MFMKRLKILFVCFVVLIGSLNSGMCRSVRASGNSYWLAGDCLSSRLIYQGDRLEVRKKWAKADLEKELFDSKWKTKHLTLKISPKCIVESGEYETHQWPFKKYVKKFHISKGDDLISVSTVLKIVKGKVVKIGFYS